MKLKQTTIVAMLRGINLGPHHRVAMAALRTLFDDLGFSGVRTYVQSGNVVFDSTEPPSEALSTKIEAAFEKAFGFRSSVILRTANELQRIVTDNPMPEFAASAPARLLVVFLKRKPTREARTAVPALHAGPELIHIGDRELYIWFPNGIGRSKLPFASIDKVLATETTARNMNTVTKLLEMAKAPA